jgi:hypothetical protein
MLDTNDYKAVLASTLADVKHLKDEAVEAVANEYAPRLARLAESDDPTGERDDIMTNMKLQLADLGVQAETAAGQVVAKVLQALLDAALKFALA